MEPDFTAFAFEKDVPVKGQTLKPYDRQSDKLYLRVDWKEDGKAQANSCLLTSPDNQVWRVSIELVEQKGAENA